MKQMTFRVLMRHTREQHRRTWAVVRVPGDATAKEVRDATCFAIVDRGANSSWEIVLREEVAGAVPDMSFGRGEDGKLMVQHD
jgi:hypothetical protein